MRPVIVFALLASICLPAGSATSSRAHIDHVLLGIDDLQRGMASFEQLTGVRPVYGGKHPGGTHNALVSLGGGTYLEILALQPQAKATGEYAGLRQLRELTPIGWAVSSADSAQLRDRLGAAGLSATEPVAGSRTTPTGETLSWQSFGLKDSFAEAPFFIVWSAQTPHPSTTSPTGCTVQRWRIAGSQHKSLERLRTALDLQVEVAAATAASMRLSLRCPKGIVEFD
jgi:hypothetical protein